MGVYTNSGALDNAPILEGYEPDMSGAFKIVYENELNFNKLMENIGVNELAALEETGSEIVYEAGNVAAIIEKGKQFIDKVIEKVKAIFNKFLAIIASFVKSNKDFVKKYEKEILMGSLENLEIKGYTFTMSKDIKKHVIDLTENLESLVSTTALGVGSNATDKEIREKVYEVVGGKDTTNETELSKKLFEDFRNGEDSKDTIEITSALRLEAIKTLKDYSTSKTTAEKAYKECKKGLERLKTNLGKKITAKDTSDEAVTAAQNAVKAVTVAKYASNAVAIAQSAHLKALKDQMHQSKSICVKCIGRKAPKNESAAVAENGFLTGFELV